MMQALISLWKNLQEHDAAGSAAEMTYHWVMSLLPLLIFLFSLFGLLTSAGQFEQMMVQLERIVPPDAFRLIRDSLAELIRTSSGELAIFGLLGALWIGSNGALTIEKALNRAYGDSDRDRNFIQKRLVALAIVVGMAVILLGFSNLVVFGKVLIVWVVAHLHPPQAVVTLMYLARWLIPITGLVVVGMLIYAIAPEQRIRGAWNKIWPGALTFVVLWLVISWLFSLYVANMGQFSKIYGPMGAIVILMIWLYLSSYALLVGGEVNALFSQSNENPS